MGRLGRSTLVIVLLIGSSGCEEEDPVVDHAAATPGGAPTIDGMSLRRAYTVNDIKFNECVTVQADGSAIGKDCPPGCVGYGPYVSAPRDSNVRVSFEFESKSPIVVSSDIVSRRAANVHASLHEQHVPEKELRAFSYSVHLFEPAEQMEARLWLRAEGNSNFKLQNFTVAVQ
jgi:hypothetical protein